MHHGTQRPSGSGRAPSWVAPTHLDLGYGEPDDEDALDLVVEREPVRCDVRVRVCRAATIMRETRDWTGQRATEARGPSKLRRRMTASCSPVDSPLDRVLYRVEAGHDDPVHEPCLDCLGIVGPDSLVGRVGRKEEAGGGAVGGESGVVVCQCVYMYWPLLTSSLGHAYQRESVWFMSPFSTCLISFEAR